MRERDRNTLNNLHHPTSFLPIGVYSQRQIHTKNLYKAFSSDITNNEVNGDASYSTLTAKPSNLIISPLCLFHSFDMQTDTFLLTDTEFAQGVMTTPGKLKHVHLASKIFPHLVSKVLQKSTKAKGHQRRPSRRQFSARVYCTSHSHTLHP